jgi:hypothetical protein
VIAAAAAIPSRLAAAEGGATVVLVHPPSATPTVTEALVRLRGELALAGFETQLYESEVGPDIRASLEQAAPAVDAVAVVAVLPVGAGAAATPGEAPDPGAAEVWVVDRVTRKTVVRRARSDAEGPRAAQILSVRAAELLRASFVELAINAERRPEPAEAAPQPPPPAGTAVAARWAATAIEESQRAWTYGLEVGASVLGTADGVGPSLLPILRLERALGDHGLVRLSGAGLGAPAVVTLPSGSADVTQDLLLLEGVLRFRPGRRVQPLVSLGAGALYVRAQGHPGTSYAGASGSLWSAALDGGAGVRLSLRRRIDLALEVHAVLAEPYPVIRFVGADVAHAGRPSGLASLTVVGGL